MILGAELVLIPNPNTFSFRINRPNGIKVILSDETSAGEGE